MAHLGGLDGGIFGNGSRLVNTGGAHPLGSHAAALGVNISALLRRVGRYIHPVGAKKIVGYLHLEILMLGINVPDLGKFGAGGLGRRGDEPKQKIEDYEIRTYVANGRTSMQAVTDHNETQRGWISFTTSEGADLRATLLRLTHFQVVFEVCGPNCALKTSEVLQDFRILNEDRAIYSGRAVVVSLVNIGTVVVCEAALQDGWLDIGMLRHTLQPDGLRASFDAFLRQWEKIYKIRPEYKLVIADLHSFMTEMRLWLDQVELGIRSLPSGDRLQAEREAAGELAKSTTPAFAHFFEQFEGAAGEVEKDAQPAHATFCRRQLHSLLLASPFMHRIYVKPLGYAGDYEMVNMILRDPCEGASLFAKLLNVFILSQAPAIAHRNRVSYLTRILFEETARVANIGRRAKILNLGCGPAKEVQNFAARGDLQPG